MMTSSSLGVCVLSAPRVHRGRTVNQPGYVHEVLGHAGVCYERVALEEWAAKLRALKVLVTVGEAVLGDDLKALMREWVEAGGAWLSIGGLCGMEELLGAGALPPTVTGGFGMSARSLGEGYLQRRGAHKVLERNEKPLHFFGGMSVRATDGAVLADALDKHGRDDGSPGLIEKRVGRGRTMLLAVDVTGTIVRVEQGVAVTRDAVPPRDGSAPVDELFLKSDDGAVLDWLFDRDEAPGAPGLSIFLRPVADQWREVLLRAIFYLAEAAGAALPVLWLYPRGLPALGHVSHDTDGNEPEKALLLLESLERAEIESTWCVIAPGYPAEIIARIKNSGHELAMHYDATTEDRPWGEEHFDRQWRELIEVLGLRPLANKNHYLRWEGDMEFYRWLERRGIELDQSKGPSKVGEVGFLFGTSHPFFPVHFDGSPANVLELPTLTQDLTVLAPEAVGPPLLEAAIRYHGTAHFLFHPAHFAKEATPRAMEKIVAEGKSRGIEWWTARQINAWERARRTVRWRDFSAGGTGAEVKLSSAGELKEATVLWLGGRPGQAALSGRSAATDTVTRWGFAFQSAVFDVAAGVDQELSIRFE